MIHQQLLEFQKRGIKVEKDGTNPHFKSRYTSLNEVLAKVKPVLSELQVVIEQTVQRDGLRTRLYDVGAPILTQANDQGLAKPEYDFVESFVPFVGAVDMQKLGGAITYARRYSLVSLLGLEDDDDDGNSASKPVVKERQNPATIIPKGGNRQAQKDYEDGKPPFEDDLLA